MNAFKKKYFYSLLAKYYSFYFIPKSSIVEINPYSDFLLNLLSDNDIKVLLTVDTNNLSLNFKNNDVIGGFSELKEAKNSHYILNGSAHYIRDIQSLFERLHATCNSSTRIIVSYYNSLWKPLLKIASMIGLRIKSPEQNWLTHDDMDNLFKLSRFEVVKKDHRVLIPFYIPRVSDFINRWIAPLPFFRLFAMMTILVARPLGKKPLPERPSVSVVVPARNEAGNVENLVRRMPKMGTDDELIFVEGHSTDNTWERIQEVSKEYTNEFRIKIARQSGRGKADAVRKGFEMATGDIFMILDADLTIPPEELPKFYKAITSDLGEFINGSRLVYPMGKKAMRFFNILGNKFFATAFSFVLGQRLKDTLCGTKVLTRDNYLKLIANRSYFGDFDPFGDFDLLFGATRLGLKILEIPIRYQERTYGETNIHRWKHGLLLFGMLSHAIRKIKFI